MGACLDRPSNKINITEWYCSRTKNNYFIFSLQELATVFSKDPIRRDFWVSRVNFLRTGWSWLGTLTFENVMIQNHVDANYYLSSFFEHLSFVPNKQKSKMRVFFIQSERDKLVSYLYSQGYQVVAQSL